MFMSATIHRLKPVLPASAAALCFLSSECVAWEPFLRHQARGKFAVCGARSLRFRKAGHTAVAWTRQKGAQLTQHSTQGTLHLVTWSAISAASFQVALRHGADSAN